MKNMFSSWAKLATVAVCALSLGSCSRAEYALLPKSAAPYHGVHRAAAPVPVATTPVASPSIPATNPTAPASPAAATAGGPSPSGQSTGSARRVAAPAAVTGMPAVATEAAPARKPNAVQRLALKQVTRKLDKLVQKSTARQHNNAASTQASGISGNLRTGLILLLVGVLVGLLNGTIGTIIAIIGLVFIVLWLLDQA